MGAVNLDGPDTQIHRDRPSETEGQRPMSWQLGHLQMACEAMGSGGRVGGHSVLTPGSVRLLTVPRTLL